MDTCTLALLKGLLWILAPAPLGMKRGVREGERHRGGEAKEEDDQAKLREREVEREQIRLDIVSLLPFLRHSVG